MSRSAHEGHPRVIILSNYDGLELSMLHTDFRENRPAGSGEEHFLSGFSHIWTWQLSWSCNPDFTNKLSFPLPIDTPHKISL